MIWFFWRRTETVPCRLDLERTHEHFHAHVELMEFFPEPGDSVRVEGDGDLVRLEYGEAAQREAHAVVTRASRLRRWWTRFTGRLEFYELYEVGFE
ncbi:MAG: hypothetical protein EA352_11805 [Gemmatimonadales bacterium]|nr:MAG: hypothetical protein EA352_11805 [Gemmatimonadales bacterium]